MNRNFMSHPNQSFWRAVMALRQLLLAQDLDTVQRAYAEAIWHERQLAYLQGMTSPGDTHVCLHRLLGEPCPGADCASPQLIPGFEHGSEWQTDGKTTRIVFQPYRLETATLQALLAFCEQYHLDVEISAEEAWHFPGGSLFVQLMVQEPAPTPKKNCPAPAIEMVDFS